MGVDRQTGKIIIISKSKPNSEQSNKEIHKFKIFDEQKDKFIYDIQL